MKNIKNKFIPLLISIFAAVTLGLSGCMDLFDKEDVPTSFTITFNGNGGKTEDGATTYTQNYAYGETKALMANKFSYDNKNFKGWGTNTETSSYTDEAETSFSSDTTLYAIWTDKGGTIENNGITTEIKTVIEVIIIDRKSLPTDPVATGTPVPFTGAGGYDNYYWYCDGNLLSTTTKKEHP